MNKPENQSLENPPLTLAQIDTKVGALLTVNGILMAGILAFASQGGTWRDLSLGGTSISHRWLTFAPMVLLLIAALLALSCLGLVNAKAQRIDRIAAGRARRLAQCQAVTVAALIVSVADFFVLAW